MLFAEPREFLARNNFPSRVSDQDHAIVSDGLVTVGAGSVNPMQDCRRPRRGACNVALGTARWDYASEAWPRGNALRPVRSRSSNGAAVWRRLRRACATRAGREACRSELRTSALASVPLPPRTTLVMRNRFLPGRKNELYAPRAGRRDGCFLDLGSRPEGAPPIGEA
jgi:hypothetical protein